MTHRLIFSFVAGIAAFSTVSVASSAPARAPIVGVANLAVKVSDLDAARKFYGQALGYQEAFTLKQAGGKPDLVCFKVNDHQYIEISPELKDAKEDRLIHIAFETTGAKRLRDYLASKHVDVPAKLKKDAEGNFSFTVKDPAGHAVEFIQYLPKSIHSRNFGKFMPATRVSDHILHVGVHITNRAAADAFYKDILGFRLLWAGGPEREPGIWVSMLVPDGSDWVEYMVDRSPNPPTKQLGGMNHACLEVTDIQASYQAVVDRGYKPPKPPVIAVDGRWLVNFYDPDLTRTELMIRKPVKTPCCSPLNDPYITTDTAPPAKSN
jgi:catechol 2,3-dioxygenase-like lactoylglutathione lyase family enzyme